MILRTNEDLDELLEAGRITLGDAGEFQTFKEFLREAPRPPMPYENEPGFHGPLLSEDVDFAEKWGDYMRGEA